jgi:formyltetrahydrofolate deformylase
MAAPTLIARLFGPDKPGLVARVAGWIYQRKGNIHHADQHMDVAANIFFQRVEWTPQEDAPAEAADFQEFAANELGMQVSIKVSSQRPKVALMVSKIDHCFHDTILRFKSGELAGELVCVLSNHPDLEAATQAYSIPFHYCPVQAANKTNAEATQLDWLRSYQVGLGGDGALYANSFRRLFTSIRAPSDQYPPLFPSRLCGRQALPSSL